MSLLDRGPEAVTIYPEVVSDDGYGTAVRVPGENGMVVHGWLQPVSATEDEQGGHQISTRYRLIARSLPLGAWARVEWAGREWEPLGEPEVHGGSVRVEHMSVVLAARGPAPLANPGFFQDSFEDALT